HEKLGRPCLLFHIEKCSGPCVGEIDEDAYRQLTDELLGFLDGETDEIVARMEAAMSEASAELEFERAARIRDQLESVRKAIAKQQMVGDKSEDPQWLVLWHGKEVYDADGDPAIEITRGKAPAGDPHAIDGLAGATLTGRGVENLLTFWVGQQGYGPYLRRLEQSGSDS
ncbi:MAG: UvrB/UvrC motif-containing protein, partial [Gammaproteobacteria bacterium]